MNITTIQPDQLFHLGLIICGIGALFATTATIYLAISKKRLNRRLDQEFGKRR